MLNSDTQVSCITCRTMAEFNNMEAMVIVPHIAVYQISFEYTPSTFEFLNSLSIN